MLAKCANPACEAAFRYLHEGKVFRLELNHPSVHRKRASRRNYEYFWLCGICVESWTVAFEQQAVTVRPLRLPSMTVPVPAAAKGKAA